MRDLWARLSLSRGPRVASFRDTWLSVPEKLTEHPGDAYRVAAEVMEATEPLLTAVRQRQETERERDHPDGNYPKPVLDRQQRELTRATDTLYVTGLKLLASFYRDTATAALFLDLGTDA